MKVIGRAEKGKGAHAQHTHPVVLTTSFKKQETSERAHRSRKDRQVSKKRR